MERQEQLLKLSILPVNKTVVFYSPIEGKDVLVRTGTISDDSCCYHSVLHAYSKDYISMDEQGRKKLVERLRSSLADKVDRERWEQLSGGLVAKIPFQENVNTLFTNFYKYIQTNKSGKTKSIKHVIRKVIKNDEDTNTYNLILEMITQVDFEKRILPNTYDSCAEKSIKICKEKLIKNTQEFYKKIFNDLKEKIDEKRVQFCVQKLTALVDSIVDEAESSAFDEYITNLKNTSVEVDRYTIGLISTRLNRDIFFLDSRNRMPYQEGGTEHIQKRKAIILLWTGGVHYEIVGRLLPGNKIQREFEHDDPLIVRIRTFLCNPEKIADEYPKLIPYLSKEHRQNVDNRSADKKKRERRGKSKRSSRESSSSSRSDESSSDDYESSSVEDSDVSKSEKKDTLDWLGHSSPKSSKPSPIKESRRKKEKSPDEKSKKKHKHKRKQK